MTRRHRIPGTSSPRWRREIVCGVDPIRALVRAVSDLPLRGGVWTVAVRHDDGCPAIETGMGACTCELVELAARRAA